MSLLVLLRPDYANFVPLSFHGGIDEVAVYSAALDPARIRQHYQTGLAIPGRYSGEVTADNPEGYWRLNDTTTTAADATGRHNGTYTGTTTTSAVLDLSEANNTLALYFREASLDENTMLDLDGLSQAAMEAMEGQPDLGIARYGNRVQSDLDAEDQVELDDDTQFTLERVSDVTSQAYLEVKVVWTSLGGTLTIKDSDGMGYTFTDVAPFSVLTPNVVMLVNLEDEDIRVRLWAADEGGGLVDDKGGVLGLLYDTGVIRDPILIKRRKGRVGWFAQFADGDAAVENIRSRGLSFGEVVTKTLASMTPVHGAALMTHTSADKTLFNGLPMRSPWGGTVTSDPGRTSSGKAMKVVTSGTPLQGIQTGRFVLDDLQNLSLSFDINFPSSGLTTTGLGLEGFLYGENARIIPVNLGGFRPDRWQTLKVNFNNDYFQTGEFVLMILQTTPFPLTWWVDNFDLRSRSVTWAARGNRPDPWDMEPQGWVDFKNTVNRSGAGVRFDPGKELQVRGRAARQDAFISDVKAIPKYAELGRFYWSDEHPPVTTAIDAAIGTPVFDGRMVTLDGRNSTSSGGQLIAYHWSLGDGSEDFGPTVSHFYPVPGKFTITLTVVDSSNRRNAETTTVTVT